jgi:glycosyltransferase involved in cell wall biosynthesis
MCILAAPGAERFVRQAHCRKIEVVSVPAGPHLNPALIWLILRQIKSFDPNIVHTHLVHADLYGQVACSMASLPGVSSIHSTHSFYRNQPFRTLSRLAGRLPKRTLAISEHVGRFLDELHLRPGTTVRVVPYGIEPSGWRYSESDRAESRSDLHIQNGEIAVGIASRLIENKGHSVLVDAMGLAIRQLPQLKLIVAGEGPLLEPLKAQAARSLPSDKATFVGFIDDIKRVMAACDVFVFPTLPGFGEGFGLASLEAMAAGLPVVASDLGPLPEVVVDGETGLLVRPGDVDALTDAILRLASRPELMVQMGQQGRLRAATEFSLERMVDSTSDIYHEVLQNG